MRKIALKTTPKINTPRKQSDIATDMVVFEGGDIELIVKFRVRECGLYESAPIVNTWYPKLHEMDTIQRDVHLAAYALEKREVTNHQFQAFLLSADYRPEHRENFLKHWVAGKPPVGEEDYPVVYIDLDDARAYAQWAGKRLPTEEEWQHGLNSGLVGYGARRVWNWTESERSDGRTRFCILKGGSDYHVTASVWYADGGPQSPDFSAKFLLMWPGLDRCATIGFRCAVDVSD